MKPGRKKSISPQLAESLSGRGLRLTAQRREVYALLLQKLDHPTAQDVFLHAKRRIGDISLATVYNCLDALVACGLVRRVQVDPSAARFCPNMKEHSHFYCEACGGIYDVGLEKRDMRRFAGLPRGFVAQQYDVSLRGLCADCAGKDKVSVAG